MKRRYEKYRKYDVVYADLEIIRMEFKAVSDQE